VTPWPSFLNVAGSCGAALLTVFVVPLLCALLLVFWTLAFVWFCVSEAAGWCFERCAALIDRIVNWELRR